MSPLSEATLAEVIGHVEPCDALLDVGCGKAAFARRVLLRERARRAVCVERNPVLAAQGQARGERDGLTPRLTWVVGDVGTWRPPGRVGALAVLGASHALGGLGGALAFAAEHLEPGGTFVLGEGIWATPPPSEYLRFLGTDGRETPAAEELATALRDGGFSVVHRHRSTAEEWAAYEAPYFAALAAFVADDGRRPFAAQAAAFAEMQARHGRAAMGFETVVATLG